LTAADSLDGYGARSGDLDLGSGAEQLMRQPGIGYAFEAEDLDELNRILGQRYHAVVGNPPYITVKDRALNRLYRGRYSTCHRQYSLAMPFTERFFQLAVSAAPNGESAGFIGMITADSFMKREFGKKLVENFFPKVDLTHVIHTSGAYIPGHGTPTVILFGRERAPLAKNVRTVMGIRGEPSTPQEAAKGMVWSAIVEQVDRVGSESEWVSVADTLRVTFKKHPWSIGGGGASDLKESIEDSSSGLLSGLIELPVGRAVRIAEEEAFIFDRPRLSHSNLPMEEFREFLIGECVRDWLSEVDTWVWYPYFGDAGHSNALRHLWTWRNTLVNRKTFQGIMSDAGLQWYEYMQHTPSAYRTPLSIPFAFVATHNHFVLDRGGKVFNRSAPVIKLPAGYTKADHLALLGLLNSSTACFWMKQIFHSKGDSTDSQGARLTAIDAFANTYEFTGTGLQRFPIPDDKPLDLATELDRLARERQEHMPAAVVGGRLQRAGNQVDLSPPCPLGGNPNRRRKKTSQTRGNRRDTPST
jgi:Eco57I restriction-modification methylase